MCALAGPLTLAHTGGSQWAQLRLQVHSTAGQRGSLISASSACAGLLLSPDRPGQPAARARARRAACNSNGPAAYTRTLTHAQTHSQGLRGARLRAHTNARSLSLGRPTAAPAAAPQPPMELATTMAHWKNFPPPLCSPLYSLSLSRCTQLGSPPAAGAVVVAAALHCTAMRPSRRVCSQTDSTTDTRSTFTSRTSSGAQHNIH